ncbi:MAG TPA: helix-turn-helix domain-containing protein [Candidatus Acidoferrales bacterium]|jgi:putative transcriptional regulator|nr:helix-turn-helix domain-containing protein [Candidatus Acidoferrales bacterium]
MARKKGAPKAGSKSTLNRVSRGVIAGLKQAVAHTRGKITLPVRYYDVPGRVDVKAIRTKSGLSQMEFAGRYGLSVRTLQDWELGRTQPPSAVRAYLIVIDRFPDTVDKALRGAA